MIFDKTLFDRFIDDLNEPDPLQVILRGHLYIESQLISLINLNLQYKEKLDQSKFRFPTKVELLLAMGVLTDEDKLPILYLNSIRNKLAHDLNFGFTKDVLTTFLSKFPEVSQSVIRLGEEEEKEDELYLLRAIIAVLYMDMDQKIKMYATDEHLTQYF